MRTAGALLLLLQAAAAPWPVDASAVGSDVARSRLHARTHAHSRSLTLARERLQRLREDSGDGGAIGGSAGRARVVPFSAAGVPQAPAEAAPLPAPSVAYDPDRAARRFAKQPVRVLARQAELAVPLTAFFARVLAEYALGVEKRNRAQRAAGLLGLLSAYGPAVIKGGQALASRADLLPPEYLEALQRLQDDVPPFPSAEAFRVIREELGGEPGDFFEDLSPEPIAAASLGQVYRGRRRGTNEPLAVKVQRPGCADVAELDLHILRGCALAANGVLRLLRRDVNLVSVVDDLGNLLFAELDYTLEAASARRFGDLYARPGSRIAAPRVFGDLCTRRVLVEAWVDGVRITDRDALAAWGLETDELVQALVQCSLRQMLENGFFHADPHAGNLLVTPDGTLTYIDFGMMSYVTREQRLGLVEAVVHVVNRDFTALAELYKQLGFIPEREPVDPIVRALHASLPDVLDSPVSELNIANVFSSLGSVMFEYPFALPPFYTAVIRCLGVLEVTHEAAAPPVPTVAAYVQPDGGPTDTPRLRTLCAHLRAFLRAACCRLRCPQGVALQADSNFPVIKAAYPFVASKLLTDPSPQLQRALLDLLRRRDEREAAAHLVHLVALLDHAMAVTDPLTLTERLAQIYLIPEHADLVRELMDQAVDVLDYLAAEGSPETEARDATEGPCKGGAPNNEDNDVGDRFTHAELKRTAQVVQRAVRGTRNVLRDIVSGSSDAHASARRLAKALLADSMGQQFVLEFGLKVVERVVLRSAGTLLDWPEQQLPSRLRVPRHQ